MTEARNSSIELLRIIAMMMIISHHYIVGSQINTLAQPISFHKLFADCILRPGGKIGVTIFFLITAWFLSSMKEASSKKCFRKILQIEKEMLFYSITICIFSFLFLKDYFSNRYFLISFFPTIFRLWWYPTSYIVFFITFSFPAYWTTKNRKKVFTKDYVAFHSSSRVYSQEFFLILTLILLLKI